MSKLVEPDRDSRSSNALFLRLCVSYALAAFLWVVALDWALKVGYADFPYLQWLITGKNLLFVVLSAFGLWDFATKFFGKRKDREDELLESKERLRMVSRASHDALWMATCEKGKGLLNIAYANPGFNELWGRSVDDINGKKNIFGDWIHKDDATWAKSRTDLFFAGKGGSVLDAEFRLMRPDGTSRWIWTKAEIEFDTKGHPLRIAGVTRDLTSRKKTELALSESERLFKSLFDLSQDSIALCTMDGSFINVNNAFVEMAGYDRKELLGMTFQSLTYKGWKQEENRIFKEEVFKRGYSEVYEKKCRRKDGNFVLASVRVSVFYDSHGSPAGMFGIMRDIQKEKRQLEEIVDAKEEAESANIAQNRFLSVLSHELRTPLNPIIGYADLLLSKSTDKMETDFLNIIRDSASTITKLIGDILDYAKIESGEIDFDRSPFRINELIAFVASKAERAAAGRGNAITFSYDWKKCAVMGDKERIRQILDILVSNACKFTQNGEISLGCDLKKGSGYTAVFRFKVVDSGIGIAEDQIASIFRPFEKAIEFPGVGVGLGLAMASQLAIAMGGKISVKSQKGAGSKFQLDLPLPVVAFEEGADLPVKPQLKKVLREGHRVLVVEDDAASLDFTETLLNDFGCEVSVAKNGEESLDLLREKEFDLVLMDVSMPVMSGYEATNRLRHELGKNQSVPIVAMTADVTDKSQGDCLNVGMNDFLAKPISLDEFESVLCKWLER